jgi:hypothetical protein
LREGKDSVIETSLSQDSRQDKAQAHRHKPKVLEIAEIKRDSMFGRQAKSKPRLQKGIYLSVE